MEKNGMGTGQKTLEQTRIKTIQNKTEHKHTGTEQNGKIQKRTELKGIEQNREE